MERYLMDLWVIGFIICWHGCMLHEYEPITFKQNFSCLNANPTFYEKGNFQLKLEVKRCQLTIKNRIY